MGFYRDFLKKLGHFQVEHPYFTVIFITFLTIAIYGGVSQVRTVASLEQMMPSQIEEIKAFNVLRDNYMGQDMIALIFQIDRNSPNEQGVFDVRDKRVYDYVNQVENIIREESDIITTYSYASLLNGFYEKGSGAGAKIQEKSIYETSIIHQREDVQLDDMQFNRLMSNPIVKEELSRYINDDHSVTMLLATTDVSADDPRMNLLSSKIKDYVESTGHPPGIEVRFTGTPIIQQKLGELIALDRANTQRISTLFVFVITMLVFGTFTSALLPIFIVTASVDWLYGIMGYTGLPISTLAGGVAAMVIGIGIDYSIHLMNKFKNTRKEGYSIKESVEIAITNTGTALTGAAVATILAFLAFLLGSMPEMNRFGLLMAIGVSAAFIFSLIGLPAMLILEEKLIHYLRKKIHFGVEGEYMLFERSEVHPETHEEVEPGEKDLKHLMNNYKIVAHKNDVKNKGLKKKEEK